MEPAASHPGVRLTPSRLALLKDLTRAVAEAVTAGDLDRADWLLRQRQAALARLDLREPADPELARDLAALRELERQLLDFCRAWQEIIRERLAALSARQEVQRAYQRASAPPPSEPET